MALRIQVAARAAAPIRAAANWWSENRLAAPGAIGVDLAAALAVLAEQPGIGAPCEGTRVSGVRRLFLGRVGYFIYYKVERDSLRVLAFWHARRGVGPSSEPLIGD